jgi:hypothetical protein
MKEYFRYELKYKDDVSLHNEMAFEDGERVPYIDTIIGCEELSLATADFREFCNSLCERDRRILELGNCRSDGEVAKILNMSRAQVVYYRRKLRKQWRERYGY